MPLWAPKFAFLTKKTNGRKAITVRNIGKQRREAQAHKTAFALWDLTSYD